MGEINSNTVFLKDDQSASLSDFSEGERVIVQWREIKGGEVIELVEAYR
jgi:hypothetical protein